MIWGQVHDPTTHVPPHSIIVNDPSPRSGLFHALAPWTTFTNYKQNWFIRLQDILFARLLAGDFLTNQFTLTHLQLQVTMLLTISNILPALSVFICILRLLLKLHVTHNKKFHILHCNLVTTLVTRPLIRL